MLSADYGEIRILMNNQHIHLAGCDEESLVTDQVDVASKKIRDSIEFTSMTNSAKNQFSLGELNSEDEEKLSDALISELKAIANGNFSLGGDPIIISA